MTNYKTTAQWQMLLIVTAFSFFVLLTCPGCKKKQSVSPANLPTKESFTAEAEPNQPAKGNPENVEPSQVVKGNPESADTDKKPEISLESIIKNAYGWGPIYQQWYGKTAPDFEIADIDGNKHRLSSYRGKDVMLVFWATWCGPCKMEVPHLIELQKAFGKEKLAVLAISYIGPFNTTEMVKKFIADNKKINYTVFSSDSYLMPVPFKIIEYIPSAFFIDSEGKIKLATTGLLSIDAMGAILRAK